MQTSSRVACQTMLVQHRRLPSKSSDFVLFVITYADYLKRGIPPSSTNTHTPTTLKTTSSDTTASITSMSTPTTTSVTCYNTVDRTADTTFCYCNDLADQFSTMSSTSGRQVTSHAHGPLYRRPIAIRMSGPSPAQCPTETCSTVHQAYICKMKTGWIGLS